MGFVYQGKKLCCDLCGTAGARKVNCPFGYCQAIAACPECRISKKDVLGKTGHRDRGCEAAHLKFEAEHAEREKLLAEGELILASGLGVDGGFVHAIFQGKDGCVGRMIPDTTYRHWAERPNPTLAWFEALAGHSFKEVPENYQKRVA